MDGLNQDGFKIKNDLNSFTINVILSSVIGLNVTYDQPDHRLMSVIE